MQKKMLVFFSVLVLGILNYGIYEKEQIKSRGETLLLKLAPVDPRSLMQGDYMRLRYAIERDIPKELARKQEKRGYMVILPDEKGVAAFVGFYQGETLARGEKLLRYHKKYDSSVKIVPDSFLFQEGHGAYYQAAEYGEFRIDNSGNHVLVGLTDKNYQRIVPE